MAVDVQRTMDFGNSRRIINLPDGTDPQHPATVAQLNSSIEGLAWKDSVVAGTVGNIDVSSPGATIDGITMASGDRVLVKDQTTTSENGIYIWNGAAVAMTRSDDASTSDELESAIISIDEGTNAGTNFRQTQVNFILDTDPVLFVSFAGAVPTATETTSGTAEIATQVETNAGIDDTRFITPLKLATSPWAKRQVEQTIGDGSATSYTITHNLNTRDVSVVCYRNSGNFDDVIVEIHRTSVNSVTILFDDPPASNAYRVIVRA